MTPFEQLGYFTADGDQAVPTHDPGPAALCPVCELPMGPFIAGTISQISFRVCDERSYFFRYHTACGKRDRAAVDRFEDLVVDDAIARASLQ